VSGLALGIDAIAHRTALEVGLSCVGIPGSGLDDDVLYPRTNVSIARRIVESGGALVSEFEPTQRAAPWTFPKRNRIMAGMSHATLLIEATERSGTLITARLASDYNRELLAVPGSIFSEHSHGTHQFIKLGATPVTSASDVLAALHLEEHAAHAPPTLTPDEQVVWDALSEPRDSDALVQVLKIPIHELHTTLTLMELGGHLVEYDGHWRRSR
jgi:DNA processing protein